MSIFDNMIAIGYGLVFFGILISIGALVMLETQQQVISVGGGPGGPSTNTTAYNVTVAAMSGIGDLTGWIPIIVVLAIAVLIIGLVMAVMGQQRVGGGGFA